MQIRLTVVDPLGPSPQRGRAASRDVLVTAPTGTDLAAVASALAGAVTGEGRDTANSSVVLYAGTERLDPRRCTLGEPPLVDGAVLSLGAPAAAEPHPELDDAPTQLHVVAGPDAGGVHLLHGGRITVGRSADADVPLDDPDVSRLHCAVTVGADGRVSVADLGSTNGTALDGVRVGERPVQVPAGGLLRIGESALRVAPSGGLAARARTVSDGEGCLRVARDAVTGAGASSSDAGGPGAGAGEPVRPVQHGYGSAGWGTSGSGGQEHRRGNPAVVPEQAGAPWVEQRGGDAAASGAAAGGDTHAGRLGVGGAGEEPPGDGRKGAPVRGIEAPQGARRRGLGAWARRLAGGRGEQSTGPEAYDGPDTQVGAVPAVTAPQQSETWPDPAALLLTALGPGPRLWERGPGHPEYLTVRLGTADRSAPDGSGVVPAVPVTAALREAGALGLAGPRPRLSGLTRAVLAQLAALHSPDLLEIVLISADRSRPVEERTAEWSWLGWLPHVRPGHGQDCRLLLAYDREQAAARTEELLRRVDDHATTGKAAAHPTRVPAPGITPGAPAHSEPTATPTPDSRTGMPAETSGTHAPATGEWDTPAQGGLSGHPGAPAPGSGAPAHGRATGDWDNPLAPGTPAAPGAPVEGLAPGRHGATVPGGSTRGPAFGAGDIPHAAGASGPAGAPSHNLAPGRTGTPAPGHTPTTAAAPSGTHPSAALSTPVRRPSWAREDAEVGGVGGFAGPCTVVVVDGDPGGGALRDAVARLAVAGPRAGIHVICLAETEPSSPASPVALTYEAACAVAPTFRHCGAVALLGGDVATALRLLRVAPGGPVGTGTLAAVDAVSLAWAERFARALAPLRPDGPAGEGDTRVAVPLPQSARLLDELGLARATPASLMARWADAADDAQALGGRARAVLGAGPRGPLTADLVADGPHLLIEGPSGSGRTELLRAVVASLAAAERPDRLGVVLIDGRDGVGTGPAHGEGLRVCTDIPHVTTHLIANDPVRMREFAQSLAAELKRRAELLGRTDFARWHTGREVSGRIVAQRTPAPATGDIDAPPSSTLRLRPGSAARQRAEAAPPLPRLVVVVDDLDALVAPPLGSPGRPAAGSVMRALEAVAREGERLGVHLVAAAGTGGRTAETEPARRASLRVVLDAPQQGPDEPAPGRGRLACADGRVVGFQGGRVTGRIPRTATQRPTVVPLDWQRMGDPPARRPVRELGNGPTDLALLASAVERAAREVSAAEVPSLL
ncbi:FHA domain-containing protein [Streptomyces barringtoniae]|uniref:FHA domain-containing protein n=1 Tax=Streptomyces barringtoniae TaxID=2892029 RepID=UPI001E42939A|nr:FHA domain-containing protein [Streptomyces barringtoniae]MCC5477514.1 FHA domain-containing protein [Streptomyces barringtoniae]